MTTQIIIHNDTIFADSSGTWVRIDSTADSCSYPFFLTDQMDSYSNRAIAASGGNHPIGIRMLSVLVDSDRTDSNQIKFNIDTRDRIRILSDTTLPGIWQWTEWTPRSYEKSGGGITVLDTVSTDSTQSTSKQRQKLHFNVHGIQARLCPEIPETHPKQAADTTTYDSILYIGR